MDVFVGERGDSGGDYLKPSCSIIFPNCNSLHITTTFTD
jgi:hypothetical protein